MVDLAMPETEKGDQEKEGLIKEVRPTTITPVQVCQYINKIIDD